MMPIRNHEKDKLSFDLSCDLSDETCGIALMTDDISFDGPIQVSGEVVNHSGYMQLSLRVNGNYRTHCARCLCELTGTADYAFVKNVAVKGSLQNEDTEDYLTFEGNTLDLDAPTEELLFLELPQKQLCREDCKGLCSVCGKDLNTGSCNCTVKEIDPRLAVLKELL